MRDVLATHKNKAAAQMASSEPFVRQHDLCIDLPATVLVTSSQEQG